MRGFVIRAAIVALGLWLASELLPGGVEIRNSGTLIAAAVLLAVINAIVRPVLIILTLPITLLTLGLFLLVINGLMIELVGAFLSGFQVHGLGSAILAAIIISITSWLVNGFIGHDGRVEVITVRRV